MGGIGAFINGAWSIGGGGRFSGGHPATLTNVEDLGIVLQPIQVTGQFLGHVALPPSGEANHDDNQLGTNISLSNTAIGGDFRLGQTGDIEGSSANAAGGGRLGTGTTDEKLAEGKDLRQTRVETGKREDLHLWGRRRGRNRSVRQSKADTIIRGPVDIGMQVTS